MLGKQKSKSKEISLVVQQKDSVISKIIESRRETIQGIEGMKQNLDEKDL